MKKYFGLFLVCICCRLLCVAQQGERTDSSGGRPQATVSGSSAVFSNFVGVVKEYNRVSLQWDVDSTEEGNYFVIERGTDGERYETIGVVRRNENGIHYELIDAAPPNGSVYYRIRYTGGSGNSAYSKIVQLSLSGEVDFKFYPNPVDKLFIIRTEHAVDIQVIDNGGAVRVNRRLQAGIQVVNVSFLERGIYVLRVADKESNRVVSHQLLKN